MMGTFARVVVVDMERMNEFRNVRAGDWKGLGDEWDGDLEERERYSNGRFLGQPSRGIEVPFPHTGNIQGRGYKFQGRNGGHLTGSGGLWNSLG